MCSSIVINKEWKLGLKQCHVCEKGENQWYVSISHISPFVILAKIINQKKNLSKVLLIFFAQN